MKKVICLVAATIWCYYTPTFAQENAKAELDASQEKVPKKLEGIKSSDLSEAAEEVKKAVSNEEKKSANDKVMVKSATSKALDQRLRLATSLGLVRSPEAAKGTYAAGGGADVSLLWDFVKNPGYSLLASLRYAPFRVDAEIEGRNYTGVVEGYHLGLLYMPAIFTKDLILVAGAELGYLLVSLDASEKFVTSKDDSKDELQYSVVTGIEWRIAKKISIGPRIYYGFGNIQVGQVGASFSFLF